MVSRKSGLQPAKKQVGLRERGLPRARGTLGGRRVSFAAPRSVASDFPAESRALPSPDASPSRLSNTQAIMWSHDAFALDLRAERDEGVTSP